VIAKAQRGSPSTYFSIRRRITQQEVQEVLKRLHPLDMRLLQWLLRYPFQRAEDLAVASTVSIATVYRHLGVLQHLGLIERVLAGTLGRETCWLYHLSNLGLHVLAAQEQTDPLSLAQRWRTDERGLLRLLPRLAGLVTVQNCINGLVTSAPEALAQLGRRSEIRWHWVRDYAYRFTYREKVIRCTADAALLLRVRLAIERGRVSAEEQWYCLLLLLDPGVSDANLLRQRLKHLLCFRECAERWPVYQHFPPVLVLTSTSRQSEHWQRCAGEAALQLQVAPLVGAITCLPVERDAGSSNPWRLAWKTLSTTVPCRLQDLLLPLPAEAVLPGLLNQPMIDGREAVPPVDASSSPPRRLSRIISGHFMERASSVEQVKIENAGRSNWEERAALAFLGLRMDRRHLELLDLLLAHPLLDVPEMAILLDLESSSMERYVRALRNQGSIEPVATRVGQRWRLSELGLRLVAAMHHVTIQSIALSPEPSGDEEEVTLVQRGLDVLLRHLEHTVGVYSFFAALCQAARQERALGREHRLLWWETGLLCERRYRDHDRWHNLRPDAMGDYQAGEQRVRFWLEWDRATMGTRDLVTKFRTYAHYAASREWSREHGGLPLLLVVAPGKAQERRIARIASVLLRETPAPAIATTTATRLAELGPLAAIWYREPTTDQQTEMLPRSRFYNASSPR
jgi:predicted transcriptional regulator